VKFLLIPYYIGADDAYIYLRYAQNIVSGNGWSFNIGEPTYGITSPAWMLIMATGKKLGLDAVNFAMFISILFWTAIPLIIFSISKKISQSNIIAYLAAILVASDPWMIRWSGTIMETAAATFCATLFFLLLISAKSSKGIYGAFLWAGISILFRPELTLLLPIAILWLIFSHKANFKVILISAIIWLVPVIPWLYYAYMQFGTIIPNTAIKMGGFLGFSTNTAVQIAKVISIYLPGLLVAIFLEGTNIFKTIKKYWFPLAFFFSLILFYVVKTNGLQSPARYLLPALPFFILFITGIFQANRKKIIAFLIVSVIFYCLVLGLLIVPTLRIYKDGYLAAHKQTGLWIKENTPPDTKIAVFLDIGVIGYYSNRYIYDMGMLITPEIANYESRKQFLFEKRPEYIVFTQRNTPISQYKSLCLGEYLIPIFSYTIPKPGVGKQRTVYIELFKIDWNKVEKEIRDV